MSQVGNVENMFGSEFNVVTTNASAYKILEDSESSFITTSLIVSSPTNEFGTDKKTPSILVTDFEGKPLRLTYTMQPGSGLISDPSNPDVLKMSIQEKTLKTDDNGAIYVDAKGLIPENTDLFVNDDNEIDLHVEQLADYNHIQPVNAFAVTGDSTLNWKTLLTVDPASFIDDYYITAVQKKEDAQKECYQNQKLTINLNSFVDDKTIKVIKDNGVKPYFKVMTHNLVYASPSEPGVVKYDNSTIKMDSKNNQLYVDIKQLPKLGADGGAGILYIDPRKNKSSIFYAEGGKLGIKTMNMPKIGNVTDKNRLADGKYSAGYGVGIADGKTIKASQRGELSVITENLSKPNGSSCGIVRADKDTILEENGMLYVNTPNLADCSTSKSGVCKYDGNTIVKDTSGRLKVAESEKWNSEIQTLKEQYLSLHNMYTRLQRDFTDFMVKMTTTEVAPFELTYNGESLSIVNVFIPYDKVLFVRNNMVGTSTFSYGNGSVSTQDFEINYAAGYPFKIQVAQQVMNNGITLESITVNDKAYNANQKIQMTSNNATLRFNFGISAALANATPRKTVMTSFFIVFMNSDNKVIRGITLNVQLSGSALGNISYTYNEDTKFTAQSAGGFIGTGTVSEDTLADLAKATAGRNTIVAGQTENNLRPTVTTRLK